MAMGCVEGGGYTELRRFTSPWKAERLWRPVETELMADRRAPQKQRLEGVWGQRPGDERPRSTQVSEVDKSRGMIMGMEYCNFSRLLYHKHEHMDWKWSTSA